MMITWRVIGKIIFEYVEHSVQRYRLNGKVKIA